MSKIIYRCYRQQNLLWLRVAVGRNDNKPIIVRLLIDTGASYTVLPIRILQKVGCNLDRTLTKKKIVAANGTLEVPIVTVPWFNCLGIKRKNYSVAGLNLPASSFVDGLLGMEFLREVGAIINVAKAEIRLENQNL